VRLFKRFKVIGSRDTYFMTQKKSTNTTFLGLTASLASLLGIGCGSGACLGVCGAICTLPIAHVLGISAASLAGWTKNILPVLTAISATTLTLAYCSLYQKPTMNCNDSSGCSTESNSNWAKPAFWIGLLVTLGFYTSVIFGAESPKASELTSCTTQPNCETQASCTADSTTEECSSKNCETK